MSWKTLLRVMYLLILGLFFIGDIAVIILSFIISGIPAEFGFTWDSFVKMLTTFHYGAKEYGVNGTLYIIVIIVLFIICLYESISQFFASINIGYSISGKGVNRDLISVAVYIATYIILQVVMVLYLQLYLCMVLMYQKQKC